MYLRENNQVGTRFSSFGSKIRNLFDTSLEVKSDRRRLYGRNLHSTILHGALRGEKNSWMLAVFKDAQL